VITPLKSAIVDWNWVPSGSMKPTILEGDLGPGQTSWPMT